jgi:hypothetical protein
MSTLSQKSLEAIWLSAAITQHPIPPTRLFNDLQQLGEETFVLQILTPLQNSLGSRAKYYITEAINLEDIQRIYRIKELPKDELLNHAPSCPLSIKELLSELRCYEYLKSNDASWTHGEYSSLALIFVSQALGCLHYALPKIFCRDKLIDMLQVLAFLCQGRSRLYGLNGLAPSISLSLRDPELVRACGKSYGQTRCTHDWVTAAWDMQFIERKGPKAYSDFIADHAFRPSSTMSGADRSHLREYQHLEQTFSQIPTPDGLTIWEAVDQLQYFHKARADICKWNNFRIGDMIFLYTVKCLAILGYEASLDAILDNPLRVLRSIYYGFAVGTTANAPHGISCPRESFVIHEATLLDYSNDTIEDEEWAPVDLETMEVGLDNRCRKPYRILKDRFLLILFRLRIRLNTRSSLWRKEE